MHCPGLEASVVAQQNPSRARPFGVLRTLDGTCLAPPTVSRPGQCLPSHPAPFRYYRITMYYPALRLGIEERQFTSRLPLILFKRHLTLSGV